MFSKKGLGPVVATVLLLVVAVVAVVSFQTWYQSYSSQLFIQSESQGGDLTTGVERVVGETLYFKSNGDNISISKIEVGGQDCNFQNSTQKGITQIDISFCLQSAPSGTVQEAVIYTDQGIYSEEFIVTSSSSACYNPTNIGTIGTSGVCEGMLIVNNTMMESAGSSPFEFGTDGSFDIEFEGINYTFGDSQYNIFTGQVTEMIYLFYNSNFNESINYWDVSNVVTMNGLFADATFFNQPIDSWDVSSVENMNTMFSGTISFNQSINSWDVSLVTDMGNMFYGATNFNQPLNNWDTSNVGGMQSMFYNAQSFNQNLSDWNVSQVGTNCADFNTNTSSWILPKPSLDPSCLS